MFPERGQNNNVRLLQSTTAVAIPVQLPAVLRNPRACNATPKSQVPFAFWCGVVGLRKSQSLADPLGPEVYVSATAYLDRSLPRADPENA